MQTFKKIFVSIISFICIFLSVVSIIIEPMIQFGGTYYCDGRFREESAGKYDVLFMGDSDGLTSFVPKIFNKQTGFISYNYSEGQHTAKSEHFLLKQEIERNPVKRVILQVGLDTFVRDDNDVHGEGNSVTVERTNRIYDRLQFIYKYKLFDEIQDIFSRNLVDAMSSWGRVITKDTSNNYTSDCLGWHKTNHNDLYLNENEISNLYNSETVNCEFRNDRVVEFESIINLCKENEIDVCVITVPMSDKKIWIEKNLDEFSKKVALICRKNDVDFYDFNLYKNRYEILNDKNCYRDNYHMSKDGAINFTIDFSKIYLDICNNNNVEYLFYKNYDDLKKDSPYMQYL